MTTVACCGLTTLDITQYVETLPGPDEKVEARATTWDFGGPAANAAATAADLGCDSRLITVLGSTAVARLVRERLQATKVQVFDAGEQTDWHCPISSVVVTASGHRSVISRNASGEPAAQFPDRALREVAALLVDGHHLDLCIQAAQSARSLGIPVMLDGGSWKPGMAELISVVDAAVLSSDFAVSGSDDPLDAALWRDVPVAVTAGADPVRFRIGGHTGSISVATVDAVDTLGAGDVFHGAWLTHVGGHGLADFEQGLEYAAGIATRSCQVRGVRGAES